MTRRRVATAILLGVMLCSSAHAATVSRLPDDSHKHDHDANPAVKATGNQVTFTPIDSHYSLTNSSELVVLFGFGLLGFVAVSRRSTDATPGPDHFPTRLEQST